MRLRTFTGRTTMEAMGLVRAHLGPSAVIVSTQEDANGSARVMAALDDELPSLLESDQRLDKIIGEGLSYHGVAPELCDTLIRACRSSPDEDARAALAHGLASLFRFEPLTHAHRSALMLVGPPGSGKTVSAAKLAARGVLAGERVRLLSTDLVRAGGAAQLEAFAQILGMPFRAVEDAASLAAALAAADPAERVIIDTSAVNPLSAGDCRELEMLIGVSGAEPVLVFAAGGDTHETVAMAEIFRAFGCARAVVARLDTVRRLGSVLGVAHTLGLGLAEAGIAPDIADGLASFTPKILARLLLPKGST